MLINMDRPLLRSGIRILTQAIHDLKPHKFLFGRLYLENPEGKPFVLSLEGDVLSDPEYLPEILESLTALHDTLWATPHDPQELAFTLSPADAKRLLMDQHYTYG